MPDVWNNPDNAQALGKERAALQAVVDVIHTVTRGLADCKELLDMAVMEDDAGSVAEVEADVAKIQKEVELLEFRRMFSGEMDPNSAFLDIQSGSGGTEAQDWANILLRMYLRWGKTKALKPN